MIWSTGYFSVSGKRKSEDTGQPAAKRLKPADDTDSR